MRGLHGAGAAVDLGAQVRDTVGKHTRALRGFALPERDGGRGAVSIFHQHFALRIDPLRRCVSFAGRGVELTTLEFDLLHALAAQPGRVWRRDELLDRVWGRDFTGVDRVVDVHVSNLRAKLERVCDPPLLLTIRGVGYKFAEVSG